MLEFSSDFGGYEAVVTAVLRQLLSGSHCYGGCRRGLGFQALARAVEHVTVRAGQWNLGIDGAPPPEEAPSVPGDPSIHAAELWFMTPTSYQLFVDVDGAQGKGTAVVPVLALATEQRGMGQSLGLILAALGIFLSVGMLTIVGAAVRESVLKPGVVPDAQRRRRARVAIASTGVFVALMLWGGSAWWTAGGRARPGPPISSGQIPQTWGIANWRPRGRGLEPSRPRSGPDGATRPDWRPRGSFTQDSC